mgnify:CR=1 FL=1
MIEIQTKSVEDAIQMVEGLEKVGGGVVTYATERNTMTCELAIFKCPEGYILVQMDTQYPNDRPLVIEFDQHLLITPSAYAAACAEYDVQVTSVLPLDPMMQAAVCLFIEGENV